MTDEQLLMYSELSMSHFKLIRNAVKHKFKNVSDLERNSMTDSTKDEIIAAHDAVILNLYNTIPTEQDAIDLVDQSNNIEIPEP